MKTLQRIGSYLLAHLTFKRVVVLLILFVLSLPILKAVFWSDQGETSNSSDYEYKFVRGDEASPNKILEIPIDGMIMTESTSVAGPLDFLQEGVTYGYDVKETFRRAADDPSIKGILLTINSPGGTIPGSQAISDGIELYKKKTGNPVYAHIRDVGASGAYWAAVTTDKIFVDTGSEVGSIGVLMGPFVYYNNPTQEGSVLGSVTTDGGIEHTYITGGQYKDTGSPYRRMTQEEHDHWQQEINNEYNVFVQHVSHYRHIPAGTIVNDIKALPYDSVAAKDIHLVDEVANEDTAVEELVDKAGLGNDYQLVSEQNRSSLLTQLFSAYLKTRLPTASAANACLLCNTPLYLYDSSYSLLGK